MRYLRDFVFIPTGYGRDDPVSCWCEVLHGSPEQQFWHGGNIAQRLSDRWWSWAGRCLHFARRDRRAG